MTTADSATTQSPFSLFSAAAALIVVVTLVACGKSAPTPPTVQPGPDERVTGSERLGWDQRAGDAVELATFRYVVYVDGARTDASEVSCGTTAGTSGYPCSARLPSMSAGAHTLELATFVVDGSVLESARSSALRVTVAPAATAPSRTRAETTTRTSWQVETVVTTRDRVNLRIDRVAEGLIDPTDVAFAQDARIFVAERHGRVTVVHQKTGFDDVHETIVNEGELLALALDPQFEQTHFVYTVSTYEKADVQLFQLARYREANDTFRERVVLLDEIPAAAEAARAALRFGPDGKLYVALDDGGVLDRAADLASPNGKVLRLNSDGTTPSDQAGATPLYSFGYHSPRGLDWQRLGAALWIADAGVGARPRLSAIVETDSRARRGSVKASTDVLSPDASSIAFYRGDRIAAFRDNLFVASEEGQHLLRFRFDPEDPTRVISTERLLQDRVGGLRVVAMGPDGTIYFCTADAIGRLVPD